MTGPRAHRTATHTVCVTGGVGSRGCDLFACQIKTPRIAVTELRDAELPAARRLPGSATTDSRVSSS